MLALMRLSWIVLAPLVIVASNADTWTCSVCQHVYDAAKDGKGIAFEDLPDTWKCPVCGAPKSAYKKTVSKDGRTQWMHGHGDDHASAPSSLSSNADTWTCSVCQHVYDAAKDGKGVAFEDLPDTWKCPVCGASKSAYKKTVSADGHPQWVHGHGGDHASAYSPPSSNAEVWTCSVCQHVYDAAKDGKGLAFEDLPDTWKCPVCGSPKSAFKKTVSADGQPQWVHGHGDDHVSAPSSLSSDADTWTCSVCQHVYDAAKDGKGIAFEDLPDTWKCPVCGAPKSAYKKTVSKDGRTQWMHGGDDHASASSPPSSNAEVWTCSVCQHVYDAAKDGKGLAFEDLPDTWKCPVCGSPKSAFKKTLGEDGNTYWSHSHSGSNAEVWTCSVCQHVYDAAKDGKGLAFEDLPDTWKCPVCGSPKSAFKKTVGKDGNPYWAHSHSGEDLFV